MTRPRLRLEREFDARSVDKAERLLELLEALRRNPYLEPRLVLHGGTALNLFRLPSAVRLSVDIDLLYAGAVESEVMFDERDEVIRQLFAEAGLLGYRVGTPKADHAGIMSRLTYDSDRDHIKVDLNVLDRVPVRLPETARAPLSEAGVAFTCQPLTELMARKVCALFGRVAVRDLFDLRSWPTVVDDPGFVPLAVYYYSLADAFPQRALDRSVLDRFAGHEDEVEAQLYTMLVASDRPTLDELTAEVAPLLDALSRLSAEHREYLRLLDEEAVYHPELLFGDDGEALSRVLISPRMEWKLRNLRARPE